MRDNCKASSVRRIHEERKACDEAEHSRLVMRVRQANGKLEDTHDDTQKAQPELLAPNRLGVLVDDVTDNASSRPKEDVEQTKHSRPTARKGLAEVREVLIVI